MDSFNSVNVQSIDEERLRFRVIVAVCPEIMAAAGLAPSDRGAYEWSLPPLTSFGNSNHYNQATITCDQMVAYNSGGIGDAAWMSTGGIAKTPCLDLVWRNPSSQVSSVHQFQSDPNVGNNRIGGTRQLITLESKEVMDAGNVGTTRTRAWFGQPHGSPVICANPFGSQMVLRLIQAEFDAQVYIGSNAVGAGAPDIGRYVFQFTIVMVPNN
tara:strand:- start:407 stop:1042 length:636 start_codon:yes stop_codon:yes gene_type:complete